MVIKSITQRKSGDKTFYGLIMADGENEYHGSSGDVMFEGKKAGDEIQCDIKDSGREYQGKKQYYFNTAKQKGVFPKKDYSVDKKIAALRAAAVSNPDDVLETAEKYLKWLNG